MFQRFIIFTKNEIQTAKHQYAISDWFAKLMVILPVVILAFQLMLTLRQLRPLKKYFWGENNLVELVQFGFFFISFVHGMLISWRLKVQLEKYYVWGFYTLFAMGLLFIALEEVAWGQQFFQFRTPEFIKSFNVQNEFTFHNVPPFQDHGNYLNGVFGLGALIGIRLSSHPRFRIVGVPRILIFWIFWIVMFSILQYVVEYIPIHYRIRYSIRKQTETMELLISILSLLYLWLNTRKFANRRTLRRKIAEIRQGADQVEVFYQDGRKLSYPATKLAGGHIAPLENRSNMRFGWAERMLFKLRSWISLRIGKLGEYNDIADNNQTLVPEKLLSAGAIGVIFIGIISFVGLLLIPKDPKNVWLLGLSKSRIVMVGLHLMVLALMIGFYLKSRKNAFPRILQLFDKISKFEIGIWLSLILGTGFLGLGIFYTAGVFVQGDPYQLAFLIRLTPWLLWLGAIVTIVLIILVVLLQAYHRRKLPRVRKIVVDGKDGMQFILGDGSILFIPSRWIKSNIDSTWNPTDVPVIQPDGLRITFTRTGRDTGMAFLVFGI